MYYWDWDWDVSASGAIAPTESTVPEGGVLNSVPQLTIYRTTVFGSVAMAIAMSPAISICMCRCDTVQRRSFTTPGEESRHHTYAL